MRNLQAILEQDSGMLQYNYMPELRKWKGTIKHVSNGSVVLEILGDSLLEVSNVYAKWLYSPLKSQELNNDAANAENILNTAELNDMELDLISIFEEEHI